MITSDGKLMQNIKRRRAGATRAFRMVKRRFWGRREVSLKVKMKIFNAVVLPVPMYGATSWALT